MAPCVRSGVVDDRCGPNDAAPAEGGSDRSLIEAGTAASTIARTNAPVTRPPCRRVGDFPSISRCRAIETTLRSSVASTRWPWVERRSVARLVGQKPMGRRERALPYLLAAKDVIAHTSLIRRKTRLTKDVRRISTIDDANVAVTSTSSCPVVFPSVWMEPRALMGRYGH